MTSKPYLSLSKSVCQTCGTINSVDGPGDYDFNKNVYCLNPCDHNFFLDFDNTTYEPYTNSIISIEYKKEQEESKKRECMEYIARLRSSGLHDKALRDYTFENDKGYNPEMEKAHKYVEQWDKMKAMSTGLLLWGGTGTGKTFFAGCVANALIDTGVPVLMTNFARILNSLTNMFSEDRNGFIDSLNKYELLIIDDLGMERQSEFALEQVYNVIDSRYRSKRPLIVTTNLTLDELKNPADISRKRIYDRVLERCVPLKINNRNIRTMNAAMNFSAAKELLVGGDEQ